MDNLTRRVLDVQRSRAGIDGLVADLAPRVLSYPRRRFGWDEDACSEFYAWFHPRLVRLLDRFRDQGRPFDAYLASVLHWQARTFARRLRRDGQAWEAGPRLALASDPAAAAWPWPAAGPRPAGGAVVPRAPALPALGGTSRRGLLFLVLKCSRWLDDGSLAAAAAATGVPPRRLAAMARRLRAGLAPAERRLEALRLRRNGAFSRARLLEAAIARTPDPLEAAALRRRLAAARRCLELTVRVMGRVRLAATNRAVAGVVGVPKGTVDSGLSVLQRRLSALYHADRERTA
jgi:hypothetical protein